MRFKHAFHVLVDNFGTTYKLLIYRLIVALITVALACAVIIPTLNTLFSTTQFEQLKESFAAFWDDIKHFNVDEIRANFENFEESLASFKGMINDKTWLVAIAICALCVVYLIQRFWVGIGNYAVGALFNDKMTLHASSPFTATLIKNLGKASLYSIIYAPLAFAYDVVGCVIIYLVVFLALRFVHSWLFRIFLTAVIIVFLYSLKFTLTVEWLPSLIHGKTNNRQAMACTFNKKNKKFAGTLSTAIVLILTIVALNVAFAMFTLGAGLLITIPASQLILTSYEFVNYFDSTKQKYFVDEYTIIKPDKETPVSREEFFRGEE